MLVVICFCLHLSSIYWLLKHWFYQNWQPVGKDEIGAVRRRAGPISQTSVVCIFPLEEKLSLHVAYLDSAVFTSSRAL